VTSGGCKGGSADASAAAGSGPRAGCLDCGAELVYLARAEPMTCAACGAVLPSTALCRRGHFFCDACHAGSARDVIERSCAASEERDPVALAHELMRHPALKMHGPEHHFLVPAVLLTAHANLRGARGELPGLLAEARRRAEPVAGGFCGLQGACGAAIGAGIYVALAIGSTPLAGAKRSLANLMTAEALQVIAGSRAARCCKRETVLALLTASRFTRRHLGLTMRAHGAPCPHSEANVDCARDACPFSAER
jgi:hypothetical protein